MNFKIKKEKEKERLDKFLTSKLPITRSQIQKLIKAGDILVNKEETTVHRFLKKDDVVFIHQKHITERTKIRKVEPNPKIKFKIVFEDQDIIIIDKRVNLLVHPTDKYEPNTLANGLLAYYPKIKTVGEGKLRPGIVHRLDKGVSGLMLVCKTQKAFDYYKKLFKSRQMKKHYTALVHGSMEEKVGLIDRPIARSKSLGRMAVKSKAQGGKQALTKYNTLKEFTHFALLEVEILTGRTHQIRAHFNAVNHPVVGDPLYKQKNVKQKMEIDRIFLHSTLLGFKNMDGEYVEFKSKLPAKLKNIIKKLK